MVQSTKIACCPNKDKILITSNSVDVSVVVLIDHTTEGLILIHKDIFALLEPEQLSNMCLVVKYAFDGNAIFFTSSYKPTFFSEQTLMIPVN